MENWLVENPQEEKKLGVLVDHKFNMCQRSNVAAKQLSPHGSPCLHQRN